MLKPRTPPPRRVPLFNFRLEPEDRELFAKALTALVKAAPGSDPGRLYGREAVSLGAFVREAALRVARQLLGQKPPHRSSDSWRVPLHERLERAIAAVRPAPSTRTSSASRPGKTATSSSAGKTARARRPASRSPAPSTRSGKGGRTASVSRIKET